MTTDTKALIEEARALSNKRKGALDPYQVQAELEDMVDRLAAALEEATPPAGWRMTGCHREDGAQVEYKPDWRDWVARWDDDTPLRDRHGYVRTFPTARAAMEALEK